MTHTSRSRRWLMAINCLVLALFHGFHENLMFLDAVYLLHVTLLDHSADRLLPHYNSELSVPCIHLDLVVVALPL